MTDATGVTVLGGARTALGGALRRLANVDTAYAHGKTGLAGVLTLDAAVPLLPELPLAGTPVIASAGATAVTTVSAASGSAAGVSQIAPAGSSGPIATGLRDWVLYPVSSAFQKAAAVVSSALSQSAHAVSSNLYKITAAAYRTVHGHPWITLVAMVTVAGVTWAIVKWQAPDPTANEPVPHPGPIAPIRHPEALTGDQATQLLHQRAVTALEATKPPVGHIQTGVCCICLDAPNNTIFVPCGHLVSCSQCHKDYAIEQCPYCRASIERKLVVGGDVSTPVTHNEKPEQ